MTHIYKQGDRVRLVTYGGYKGPEFFPGALGTVACAGYKNGAANVSVDGAERGPLHFFAKEIEPYDERANGADISELADRMVSIGTALALRVTHVVGKEDIVDQWEAALADFRKAREGGE